MDQSKSEGAALKALLVSDLVASTRLVEELGDESAARLFDRHDRLARDLLAEHSGLEIDKTDGFLLLFDRPIHAVLYALQYHRALADFGQAEGVELAARAGIHLGEIVLRTNPPEDVARGAKPLEVDGLAKPTAARLMSLAAGGQTLLTHAAFDLARRGAVDRASGTADLRWLAHGRYLFKGLGEPIEVFEVGVVGEAPLTPPAGSAKVTRTLGEDVVLGWRPAPGLKVPQRKRWRVERKLGEGGFGEVWLAAHGKTHERRVFKFCYEAARLRALQREITLFRLLKEELGERDDIARILDWNLEEPPYFIESEYTGGGDLVDWAAKVGGLAKVPLKDRLELVAQVAEALAAAHSVGVLHKDVKPTNILITRDAKGRPRARLTDFGVGMLLEPARLAEAGITVLGFTETTPGTPIADGGTRLYTAPEILEGRAPSVQADVYALGIVLYQMTVGDLSRALAPGWRREIADELLREDIAAAVDGAPERRLGDARQLAWRLRSIDERRARNAAKERLREEAKLARETLERFRRRRRLAAVVLSAALLFAVTMGFLARRIAQEAERANTEASRARDMARVAVAREWLDRDPTRSAAVLLEIEHPQQIPQTATLMREVLTHSLAPLEWRYQSWTVAFWDRPGQRLVMASLDGTIHLREFADSDQLVETTTVTFTMDGGITDVAWSPDNRRIAVSASDGTVHIWSAVERNEALVLDHPSKVNSLSWGPDGQSLATALDDGTARAWLLNGKLEPIVFTGHEGAVTQVAFDATGDRVVTVSPDRTARIWNLDGRELAVLSGHTGPVGSARFSPAGDRILTLDGSARIWDGDGRGKPFVLRGHKGPILDAKWSPDGQRIATGSDDGTARIWNLDGREPMVLAGHDAIVSAITWSSNGRQLATASFDGTVRVWRTDKKSQPIVLLGHDAPLFLIAFQPGDKHLLACDADGVVRIWKLSAQREVTTLTEHRGWVYSARFDPEGARVATVSDDGTARIWDLERHGDPLALHGHGATVYGVAWSPDGTRLATASTDRTIRIWDSAAGTELAVLRGHDMPVQNVSWSPDRRYIASASYDKTARIWEVDLLPDRGSAPIVLRGHSHFVYSITWSPDSKRVATASQDGTARIWEVATGSGSIVHRHTVALMTIDWNPAAQQVLIGAVDGAVWTLQPDGSDAARLLGSHAGAVLQANWSLDGSHFATASWDGTAKIWQADGRGDPILLSGHEGPVSSVSFSPDGERVITSSKDRTARIWRLRFDVSKLLPELRAATAICLTPDFRERTLGELPAEALAAYTQCERAHGRSGR